MTDRMREALSALEERATAAVGVKAGEAQPFHVLDDEGVRTAARAILSGYVADVDTDAAIEFIRTMRMATILTATSNPTWDGVEQGIEFTLAQVFLAGQLYERGGGLPRGGRD